MKQAEITPKINERRLMQNASLMFASTPSNVAAEHLQNAMRAGSKNLYLRADLVPGTKGAMAEVMVADDGTGCHPQSLIDLAQSDWKDPSVQDQVPAGMGFYSMLGWVSQKRDMKLKFISVYDEDGVRKTVSTSDYVRDVLDIQPLKIVEDHTEEDRVKSAARNTGCVFRLVGPTTELGAFCSTLCRLHTHNYGGDGVEGVILHAFTAGQEAHKPLFGGVFDSSWAHDAPDYTPFPVKDLLHRKFRQGEAVKTQEEGGPPAIWMPDVAQGVDVMVSRRSEKAHNNLSRFAAGVRCVHYGKEVRLPDFHEPKLNALQSLSRADYPGIWFAWSDEGAPRLSVVPVKEEALVSRITLYVRDARTFDFSLPARDTLVSGDRWDAAFPEIVNKVFLRVVEDLEKAARDEMPKHVIPLGSVMAAYYEMRPEAAPEGYTKEKADLLSNMCASFVAWSYGPPTEVGMPSISMWENRSLWHEYAPIKGKRDIHIPLGKGDMSVAFVDSYQTAVLVRAFYRAAGEIAFPTFPMFRLEREKAEKALSAFPGVKLTPTSANYFSEKNTTLKMVEPRTTWLNYGTWAYDFEAPYAMVTCKSAEVVTPLGAVSVSEMAFEADDEYDSGTIVEGGVLMPGVMVPLEYESRTSGIPQVRVCAEDFDIWDAHEFFVPEIHDCWTEFDLSETPSVEDLVEEVQVEMVNAAIAEFFHRFPEKYTREWDEKMDVEVSNAVALVVERQLGRPDFQRRLAALVSAYRLPCCAPGVLERKIVVPLTLELSATEGALESLTVGISPTEDMLWDKKDDNEN